MEHVGHAPEGGVSKRSALAYVVLLKSLKSRGKELSQHRALQKVPGSACTSVFKKGAGIKNTLQVQHGQICAVEETVGFLNPWTGAAALAA